MKIKIRIKRFLLVAILFSGAIFANAQVMQDVVYLKNGSIIRGIIIEQVPNKSLKIKIGDGSVFVYEVADVEKITKEETIGNSNNRPHDNGYYNNSQSTGSINSGMYPNNGFSYNSQSANTGYYSRPAKPWFGHNNGFSRIGYRGFVDLGGGVGVGDYGDGIFSVSTSHGYQFNPYLFVGAGLGVDYHFDWETMFLPVFADIRGYFIDSRISPFLGVKIGYSPIDGSGVYFNPSVGASFGMSGNFALNVSLGYNLQRSGMYFYYNSSYGSYSSYEDETLGAITFKVGMEF